ncbi:MAG: dephospho-CoA kinase, partial [Bacteroidetes bacterium]|nr:dephospho-CoA kinase [Bacteroidota bacterium]
LKIGITGGIGSGKTTVAKIFSLLGVPIYNADNRSKFLLQNNAVVVAKVKAIFGEDAYQKDCTPNRPYLASQVFNNKEKLKNLEAILHPAVQLDFYNWVNKIDPSTPFILKEAALLFEANAYKDLDKIILIIAPLEKRISRIMKRDNVSREEVMARINNQWTDEEKAKLSHFIIHDDEKDLLTKKVLQLHREITKLSHE